MHSEKSTAQGGAAVPATKPPLLRRAAEAAIASIAGLAFGFTIYVFLLSMSSPSALGARDYVVRWAAGQLIVHHTSPYDADALLKVERAAGLPAQYSVMYMLNPPWTFPLLYPQGLLSLRAASLLWSLLQIVFLLASVRMLRTMYGRPQNHRHYLAYSFAPVLICLIMGQLTLLALLGYVLFLRLHRTQPFWAGASLWLCTLKPHLFFPFCAVLMAWVIFSKSYRILAGAVVSVAATSALAWLIAPVDWGQYLHVVHSPGGRWEFVPCVNVLLSIWINPGMKSIKYIPTMIGCIWALIYYWRRRTQWDWTRDGSLLLLVSILVAPYAWLYDQALAIPALLQGAYVTRSRNWILVLVMLSVLIEIALFGVVWKPETLYIWTLWTAPAWVVWYLMATRTENQRSPAADRNRMAIAEIR